MILNKANLQAASAGFRALYKESLAKVATMFAMLAMVVQSDAPEETYNWLADLPQMREWVGERVVRNLAAHGYTIRKKDWELTIGVQRDEILFDKLGLVRPRIMELARQAMVHYDVLIFELLAAGFATACYDGQYFFDSDHPVNGASQSNVTDQPLSATSYAAGRAAMMGRLNEAGAPLGIVPTHLVVPPQLEATAKAILKAQTIEGGGTNIHYQSAELVVAPWLAAHPTKWFLLDLSREVKPLILQKVKEPEFVAMDRPDDENVFRNKTFEYGVDCMDNAGYGLWQLAYGSTGDGVEA